MNITLNQPKPRGTVIAPPSKSHAHRLLICAALADRPCRIRCDRTNDDIDATVRCLTALGAEITYNDGIFTVNPIQTPVNGASLDCGESGSTLRFMLPVTAALGVDADFVLHGRLPDRPLSPLYEIMQEHGVTLSPQGSNPFHISGRLTGGNFTFDGGVSSQFTTGLLLALPLTGENSVIRLTGKVESRPYIDLTLATVRQFGVNVVDGGAEFTIPESRFTAPDRDVTVEGDWSSAAFMLCIGALSEEGVTVTSLNPDTAQGDSAVFDILAAFGADCSRDGDRYTVKKNVLRAATIDAAEIPDLIPVLSVIAAASEGTTVIRNCGRLRLKESDRMETIRSTLTSLGGDCTLDGDTIIIKGRKTLTGGTVSSFGDHRIAMSAAAASLICENPVTIEGAECSAKSYPTFFAELEKLCR
ncbi:MAG: 3-phosphoshikimate 1-carboxyvinyltransferase [Clostridia bacterium]|nr:3-phosphoshikimate 1-carboxyvinyltransferase [Clostridia bacterium]